MCVIYISMPEYKAYISSLYVACYTCISAMYVYAYCTSVFSVTENFCKFFLDSYFFLFYNPNQVKKPHRKKGDAHICHTHKQKKL